MAAGIFLILGLSQVSPLKDRCLRHCRSPLGLLIHYANYHGPLRDLRAGTHHAMYCLGCCWALMLVLVVAGIINFLGLGALAGGFFLQKNWWAGEDLCAGVGAAGPEPARAAALRTPPDRRL